jgi:hypothetical protein
MSRAAGLTSRSPPPRDAAGELAAERVEVERLLEHRQAGGGEPAVEVGGQRVAGHHEDAPAQAGPPRRERLGERGAVHVRHAQVGHRRVERLPRGEVEGAAAARRGADAEAVAAEPVGEQRGDVRLVVDHQHPSRLPSREAAQRLSRPRPPLRPPAARP